MKAPDGRECAHEEAMVACPVCQAAWDALPEDCEGHPDCNDGNEWMRSELTTIDDDIGGRRRLCPGCLKDYRRAIAREDGGE